MRHPHLDADRAANLAENPYAGQGPVLLDVGGDIGALVVHLTQAHEGAEVEISRTEHRHSGEPDHRHDPADPLHHEHRHRPHVAVVGRPAGGRVAYTAVFPDLEAGRYELTLRGEPSSVPVDVVGGEVCEVSWRDA